MTSPNGTVTIPALSSRQWDIPTYSFPATYAEAIAIIPDRPPETYDHITDTNRPINPPHSRRLQDFILGNQDAPLGTITIAAHPDDCHYQKRKVTLNPERVTTIDGQHRRLAIKEATAAAEAQDTSDAAEEIRNRTLNVLLYATDNPKTIQQLFRWYNRNKSIDPATAAYFDQENPLNRAVTALIEASQFLNQFTGRIAGNLKNAHEEYILTFQDLTESVRLVNFCPKISATNAKFVAEHNNPKSTQKIIAAGQDFWENFLPQAIPDLQKIRQGKYHRSQMALLRNNNYAMRSAFHKILATAYHIWSSAGSDPADKTECLATLDTNRGQVTEESLWATLNIIDPNKGVIAKPKDEATSQAARIIGHTASSK